MGFVLPFHQQQHFSFHFKERNMNQDAFNKGLKTRREVLGAEYVDTAIKNADDFNMPMQELVTEYCWNEIWNRPGLDRRTRSIINLAMLTALNRPHELKLHVRGAINNGLTKADIQEVFLQTAIYCGVPAAIDSFRGAKEVFKDMGI
jgi:4-carboxymuconolactone decarboxylase